jgi:hypothetical protein
MNLIKMDEDEQMEVICNSVFVADRKDREHAILLYQMIDFMWKYIIMI